MHSLVALLTIGGTASGWYSPHIWLGIENGHTTVTTPTAFVAPEAVSTDPDIPTQIVYGNLCRSTGNAMGTQAALERRGPFSPRSYS